MFGVVLEFMEKVTTRESSPQAHGLSLVPQCRQLFSMLALLWCSIISSEQVAAFYLYLGFAKSAAQTARIASSSPNPVGTAGLGLLAKYHCVSGDLAVRLPGISR